MREIKKATEAIRTNYGIYEFFEASPSQEANSPIPAGSIELRFYFTEDGVDTLLTGAALGEKEEPVADYILRVIEKNNEKICETIGMSDEEKMEFANDYVKDIIYSSNAIPESMKSFFARFINKTIWMIRRLQWRD